MHYKYSIYFYSILFHPAPLIRRHTRFCARYKCFTLHYITLHYIMMMMMTGCRFARYEQCSLQCRHQSLSLLNLSVMRVLRLMTGIIWRMTSISHLFDCSELRWLLILCSLQFLIIPDQNSTYSVVCCSGLVSLALFRQSDVCFFYCIMSVIWISVHLCFGSSFTFSNYVVVFS